MTERETVQIDKRDVRTNFGRAAAEYDRVAVLQREVGDRLLKRLDAIHVTPERLLDLGTGTGYIARALLKRYRGARVVGLDLAQPMLVQARRCDGWWRRPRYVCGDIERMPFAGHSVDMLLSNLTLQWCNSLDAVFAEFRRVLRPGGTLLFTTFGPDTLRELRASWAAADAHTHVNRFLDIRDVGDALVRAGLFDPVLDVERFTLTYPDTQGLVRDLRALGAHNVNAGRSRGLTGRRRWQAMQQSYEAYRMQGVLPASYEVIYGHAWAPPTMTTQSASDAVVKVPISTLRRRRE